MRGLPVNSGVGGAGSGSMQGYVKRVQPGSAPHVAPALPASVHAVPSAWVSLVLLFQFLLYNPAFRQFFVSIPALPPILPLPGTLPCWTSVPTSEAGEEASPLHSYMPAPACNQHVPFCWNPLSACLLLPLFPAPDAGVQGWNPQLLNVVSLHRTALQKPTAHLRVRWGTAEHSRQECY